jgi:biopolymer transport protein ExbB/TolQ
MEFDLVKLWGHMPFLNKVVAVAMALMSAWLLFVTIERLYIYYTGSKESFNFILALRDHMQRRKLDEAIAAAQVHRRSPIAKMMQAGISEYVSGMKALSTAGPADVGDFDLVDAVNRSLERVKERESSGLRRRLGGLASIAAVAPFVGLVGTVIGIMGAFSSLKHGGGLDVVGPAISEALIMTAIGLFIAIPAAMIYNYFNGRVENIVVDMNDVSSEFVDYVLKEGRAS